MLLLRGGIQFTHVDNRKLQNDSPIADKEEARDNEKNTKRKY